MWRNADLACPGLVDIPRLRCTSCLNGIHAGSVDADPAKWNVTQVMLEREIEKARVAKAEHSGKAKRGKRVIGFGV